MVKAHGSVELDGSIVSSGSSSLGGRGKGSSGSSGELNSKNRPSQSHTSSVQICPHPGRVRGGTHIRYDGSDLDGSGNNWRFGSNGFSGSSFGSDSPSLGSNDLLLLGLGLEKRFQAAW